MTDYNDGKWHGWNGGECPVHPSTFIEAIWDDGSRAHICAEEITWETGDTEPCAFRVVKPYREPREFWLNVYDGRPGAVACRSREEAEALGLGGARSVIRVREVLDDE